MAVLLTASQMTRALAPTTDVPYEALPPDVVIETVVPNATQLVAMDFTPDGRLLYTEKTGKVRVIQAGALLPTAAYDFAASINTEGERGLLGIVVDPAFTMNNRVWVYLTRDRGSAVPRYENRVVTFVLPPDNVVTETKTAKSFPVDFYNTIHNGGNLHFGSDGKLYVSVGNNDEVNQADDPAQALSSPLGKIHRFTPAMPLSVPATIRFRATAFTRMVCAIPLTLILIPSAASCSPPKTVKRATMKSTASCRATTTAGGRIIRRRRAMIMMARI